MSAHLVRGDDPVLRETALRALVDELLGDDDRMLALEEITIPGTRRGGDGSRSDEASDKEGDPGREDARGEESSAAELRPQAVSAVLNAVSSPPFMTARRVVVVHEVGNLIDADAAPLLAYLANPLDTTELVLVAGGGKVPAALAKAVADTGGVTGPPTEEAGEVLADAAKQAGIRLRPEAAKAVVTRVALDTGRILGIVETLAAVYGSPATLDAGDVAPYLGEAGWVPVYELTNEIERGNAGAAIGVLHRLLHATGPKQPRPMHPLQVLGVLNSHYRRLLRLDDPSIRNPQDAAAALGGRTSAKAAAYPMRYSRLLGSSGLRTAFDLLHQADLDLKGARAIPGDAVLEVLVARLARLGGPGTRATSSRRSGRRGA